MALILMMTDHDSDGANTDAARTDDNNNGDNEDSSQSWGFLYRKIMFWTMLQ